MDSQGFLLLNFVADFKRLKSLTTDLELIKYVCQQSPNIEHLVGSDNLDRLRLRVGWDKWVMPMADRDPSARNDGPAETAIPPQPRPLVFDPKSQMRQASLPLASPTSAASAPPFQALNGFATVYGGFGQGQSPEMVQYSNLQASPTSATNEPHAVHSPDSSHPVSPPIAGQATKNGIPEYEADSFSDVQVNELVVIVRKQESDASPDASHPMSARTFSNGSLNGGNIAEELGAPVNGSTAVSPNGPKAVHE
jgi:la-related protein 1